MSSENEYLIDVEWKSTGRLVVKAKSREEAIEKFKKDPTSFMKPYYSEFLPETFKLVED